MADIIDSANAQAEQDLDRALSAARNNSRLQYAPTGYCLNCGPSVPLTAPWRWCDDDCRDDFMRRQRKQ